MRKALLAILLFLALGTLLATIGKQDADVSLASLSTMWSDALRDTDQVGMKLTRLSDADEKRIGIEISEKVPNVYPSGDPSTVYINDVGSLLTSHVQRHGIQYVFHVVDSPEINAFALPGGQIYVTKAMLGFAETEAELAAVLGHEIAHVDLRHCVEKYQYQETLGWLVEMAHRFATIGFSKDQERDADSAGQTMAIEAGYDPGAAAAMFQRMSEKFKEAKPAHPTTPTGEVTESLGQALGAYFRSHPPEAERARDLQQIVARNQSRLAGKKFYVGRRNLREQVSRKRTEYAEEWKPAR